MRSIATGEDMPMQNSDTKVALRYHSSTNHSMMSLMGDSWKLDWSNRPIPYKIYTSLESILLPTDLPSSPVPALDAIASTAPTGSEEQIPDLQMLARLCFFSNGVTKYLHRASGERLAVRAAACTGALFHIELYIVCDDLPDLAAGVYHFSAHDTSLRLLRAGDFRQVLVQASANEPSLARAPVIMVHISTFWRNAWKYQARAYRHAFWDDGTILANFLAVASATQMPTKLVTGFVDEAVNQLLGIDGLHEAALTLVALGHTQQAAPQAPTVAQLNLPTAPLSRKEVDFPLIQEMHRSSTLASTEEVVAWRGHPEPHELPAAHGPRIPLQPIDPSNLPDTPIETVIRKRGSTRQFEQAPISFGQLSTMLLHTTRGIPADSLDPAGRLLSDVYLIVIAVDGLQPGTYVFHPERQEIELLKGGTFRRAAQYLALGQDLGGDAAVNIYFLLDLEPVLARSGNRGYRLAQLEAAITAGKLYLAAYALDLGATGLTFFDDDVTKFFSPHAQGKSVMFLIALGHPLKRTKSTLP